MQDGAILEQSKNAYKQWVTQWRANAEAHKKFDKISFDKFANIGVGKAVLCVANGYSFEEEIETIKKHQANVDILACDKTLGHLLDHGITPDYVMVCDANVDYEKYMAKWETKLSNTTLFINVCANPKWSHNGNWKEVIFFTNKDIIHSELEFSKLSGTQNFICAGTNVSNAMVILLTQSENGMRKNFFGYDKILLIGFDYSWKHGGKYYAFNEDGEGKASYMKHAFVITHSGAFAYTSGNLTFSAQWLEKYISAFKLPVVQCSKDSVLKFGNVKNLEEQIQYRYKTENREIVKATIEELNKLNVRVQQLNNRINNIGRDHFWSYARTI